MVRVRLVGDDAHELDERRLGEDSPGLDGEHHSHGHKDGPTSENVSESAERRGAHEQQNRSDELEFANHLGPGVRHGASRFRQADDSYRAH